MTPLHATQPRAAGRRTVAALLGLMLGAVAALAQGDPHQTDPDPLRSLQSRLGRLNQPAPPRLGTPINDKALLGFLESEGRRMVEAGETMTNWSGKLGGSTCSLDLPTPSRQKLTPVELARRAESAVAVVGEFYLCPRCSNLHVAAASGVFLNEAGALATCRHVLANQMGKGRGLVVLTRDGRLCPVKAVLAADPVNDLMVVQVQGKGFTPLPLAGEDAAPGAPVIVMGHPEHHFYFLTTGVVARQAVERRPGGLYRSLSITADFAKGSSGAPVCDEFGSVVGLVDNTESIYYTTEGNQQNNLQMVIKNCSSVEALRELLNLKTNNKNRKTK
jgi:serine protease Do